jgi:hypothetical protein
MEGESKFVLVNCVYLFPSFMPQVSQLRKHIAVRGRVLLHSQTMLSNTGKRSDRDFATHVARALSIATEP